MEKMISRIITFAFLGAVGVLILTKASGFSTAVGTVVQPIEYVLTFIGTAGQSAMGSSSGSGSAQSGSSSGSAQSGSSSGGSNKPTGSGSNSGRKGSSS